MQILKIVLEEIEAEFDRRIGTQLKIMAGLGDDVYRYGYGKSLEAYQQGKQFVTDIIRKHMNDDWILVTDHLPKEKINSVTSDFFEYQVTVKIDNVLDVRSYKFGKQHWWHGPEIMDKYVVAWRENPEPYRPE